MTKGKWRVDEHPVKEWWNSYEVKGSGIFIIKEKLKRLNMDLKT